MKYAIYKRKIGLSASEYAETKEDIKYYPYIKESRLPVIINNMGGYSSFDKNEVGFIKIIEIDDNKNPLTREERYPKNSKEFEYGWIDLEGNTYNTGAEGHSVSAIYICEELGMDNYHCERKLEELGWIKTTFSLLDHKKRVFFEGRRITKKQADKLLELGLEKCDYVSRMIKEAE
jgi:hypothetical protein